MPFLIVLKISLSQTAIAQPPYAPVLDLAAGWQGIENFFAALSFDNYVLLASDPLYLLSYLKSVEIAAFATLHPARDRLSRSPMRSRARRARWQAVLSARRAAVLDVVPDPHLCLDRTSCSATGLLNQVLLALRIVDEPPAWLADRHGDLIGIVYSYLPFMVLPLYATLEKMDETLLEAAADLGCPPLEGILAGDVSAVAARRARRRAAVLHPDRRRVRHSRSARRLADR